MLIEAVVRPVTCRWPGGSARLIPGRPVEMPDEQAQKLLQKAKGKVRVIPPATVGTVQPQGIAMKLQRPDWASKWRDLAKLSDGLLPTDARLPLVKAALDRCDNHYKQGNVDGFEAEVERIQRLMKILPGAMLSWERYDRSKMRGLVDFTACDETGGLWIFLTALGGEQLALNAAVCNFQIET